MEQLGNLLGGIRAENDIAMLSQAFVKTYDFEAITVTNDFNFVVGRRGAGKSALFIMASRHIQQNKLGYVYENKPEEYEQLELKHIIETLTSNYNEIRAITRLAWKVSILIDQLEKLSGKNPHYKFKTDQYFEEIEKYLDENNTLLGKSVFKKTSIIINNIFKLKIHADLVPGEIASAYQVKNLKKWVESLLLTVGKRSHYFFDGLDEGWKPSESSTAILGGLSLFAAEMVESKSRLHILMFIRDNMFRSLCYFDGDSSRHIEGNTIRLTWDDNSLLHLVSNRLRISMGLKDIESDIKVWNRFAAGDLVNKEGFRQCLNYTLFRPRDIIVLLNTTFLHVARSNRENLIKSDIEKASLQISSNRLDDLKKEYKTVFPGLSLLISSFKNKSAFQTYYQTANFLDEEILNNDFAEQDQSDYAVLGSGKEAFFALYSVGFIGLEEPSSQTLQFCHDGSSADIDAIDAEQRCCVHPCYWKALDIQSEVLEGNVLIQVYDDVSPKSDEIADIRTKRIGQIISHLPSLQEGKDDARKFEEWALQAVKMLFSGKLTNPELKANGDAIQRRDIVATNVADKGFWKRVNVDYKSRQIVFEVKNFSDLEQDVFRQALSYSGERYGKIIFVIYRKENEGLSDIERGWVQEYWHSHKLIVFLLPATMLSRFISKLRTKGRFDYADSQLNKRLDIYERSYIALRHQKGTRGHS